MGPKAFPGRPTIWEPGSCQRGTLGLVLTSWQWPGGWHLLSAWTPNWTPGAPPPAPPFMWVPVILDGARDLPDERSDPDLLGVSGMAHFQPSRSLPHSVNNSFCFQLRHIGFLVEAGKLLAAACGI